MKSRIRQYYVRQVGYVDAFYKFCRLGIIKSIGRVVRRKGIEKNNSRESEPIGDGENSTTYEIPLFKEIINNNSIVLERLKKDIAKKAKIRRVERAKGLKKTSIRLTNSVEFE